MTLTLAEEKEALRQQVRLLCAAMNVQCEHPAEAVPRAVAELARAHKPIEAIRALRQGRRRSDPRDSESGGGSGFDAWPSA